ncbi:hypothetical protein [Lacisediminimonas sp.]|uniref:hypothetical protein n=1 Tax=Lacisediminimonas sp. TaxID=3060582 RepID=UPI0027273962|nr:hypothetical protein [Lacisediminimonas sp.]MDO8301017.1 hypothetical protein [Lacisediminimonas sp.]
MNEIIQRLMERTGLPQDKAMSAVETVLGFLKEKLPGPVASQIDSVMGGSQADSSGISGIASGIGDMFGKR